jgi:PIN domain nuclease of toxin-antitoxin system
MKMLIDTQVFVWLMSDQSKLGVGTLKALQDTSNQVLISYFSFLEMAIKASIGKLHYNPSVLNDLPAMGIELCMPTTEMLQNYRVFNASNKDPFDNMIIAVACLEKCTLVTSDQKILAVKHPGLRLQDATK